MNSLTNSMCIVDNCNVPNLNSITSQNNQSYGSGNFSPIKTLITGLFLASCATPVFASIPSDCWKKDPDVEKWNDETQVYICPKMDLDLATGSDQLEAMKILMNPEVQDILLDHPCPYGTPGYTVKYAQKSHLEVLTKFPEVRQIFSDMITLGRNNFNKELKNLNENIPDTVPARNRFTKELLFIKASSHQLNISKLFQESVISTDSTKVKLLKSIIGIRLAEPGDKDVAIVLTPNVASDWNGGSELSQLLAKDKKFWQEISQNHPIHFEEVSSIGEVYEVMQKVERLYSNIKIIHFKGHGDGRQVQLGADNSESYLQFSEETQKYQINPKYHSFFQYDKVLPIDSDGTIILSACSSGTGGITNPDNLVNSIAKWHPGVTVLGPTRDAASSIEVIHLSERKFSIKCLAKNEYVTYRAQVRMLQANSIYNLAKILLGIGTLKFSWLSELTEVK